MSLCEFVFDPSEPHLQGVSDDGRMPPGFGFTHHDVSQSNAVYTLDTQDTFILIWGDPSQHHRDNTISVLLMERVFRSHWGRSWICYCKKTNQLFGAVDKLGLFPIFHNRTGSKHTLCSNRQLMAKRLGPDCSVNTQGVIQLLAYGQLFNEVSILSGVTQLKAGRVFHINAPDGFRQQTPEKMALLSESCTSFNHSVDAFENAVSQCFKGPHRPIISLSAGLDSRLILAAALSQGLRPICLGYGESNSTDMVVASQIAEQFDLPFFRAGLSTSGRGWEIARRIARLGGGEVPTQHGHALLDENLLSITQGRSIITGTGGECYRAFYYDRGMPGYGLFSNALLRNKLVPHATRYINQEFGKLGNPFFDAFPELKPTLESTLANVLQGYEAEAETATEYMDSVYLGERVSRMVVSGQQLLDSHYDRCHPFLDPNVIQTVGNLPVSYKLGSTFHRKAIEVLCPALANIRWDKTNRPLNDGLKWPERYPALAARLNVKPSWGKSSNAMFNYESLLSSESLGGLFSHFQTVGYSSVAISAGLERLLSGPSAIHCKGVARSLALFEDEYALATKGAAA